MRVLLLGEASFVHSTLREGFRALGHDVILMSNGNNGRNCPRDIDLERDMRWGKLGGLGVLWKLLKNVKYLFGNDIVQIHNFQFVPLKMGWNKMLLALLKIGNKKVVKYCLGDDVVVLDRQAEGILRYCDTHIGKRPINVKENELRQEEQHLPSYISCCCYANRKADALIPCLYEYYLCYDIPEYHDKLHYISLPIEIPNKKLLTSHSSLHTSVKVLVGIQKERDYLKGAAYIGKLVEQVAKEYSGKIEVKTVYDVPYNDYLKLLDEADVLVDQLYSYTPSMNSIAAMAHGTVVIGGGEEEYYDFIGEKELRPIINVRPEEDEYNINVLRNVLPYKEKIIELKRQGMEFVCKYHDHLKVCQNFIDMYESL